MPKVDATRQGRPVARGRSRRAKPAAVEQPAAPSGIPAHVPPLIDEITSAGGDLVRDPTGKGLLRYRLAVQQLLDTAVHGSMRVASEQSLGVTRKVFSTIARVNVALSELAEAVLGRQKDVCRAAHLVDLIKGLVVDLYR